MGQCLQKGELEGLRSGRLSHDQRARIDSHVLECTSCSRKARDALTSHESGAPVWESNLQASTALYREQHGESPPSLLSIEGFEIISEIHRGGQGIVYKALQKSTNRIVAIKILPHEYSATDRQKRRFEREVALASNLHHPNIVTVHDSGLAHGRYYYVMEYVHGEPLDVHAKTHGLNIHAKLELFVKICDAVSDAHRHGITHRDLKPRNVLVDARGEPHVLDFGLAKGAVAGVLEGNPVSMTSEFMGTLAYAAPEQTRGDPSLIDARTDVYSLGVMLFELLTGELPYQVTGDVVQTFKTIREAPVAQPSKLLKSRHPDLDTVVLRALAKDHERRYQTVADFGRDVQHLLAGEPIEARRDSAAYVLRMQSRALLVRHPIARTAAIALAITAAVVLSAEFVFMAIWNQPMHWFERTWTNQFAPPLPDGVFQQVRIVAMTDETHAAIEEIAAQERLADVTTSVPRSLRRLHGRFLEKIAEAKRNGADIKGIVLDIFIGPAETEQERAFTNDLVRGIRALQDVGIEPIFPVKSWIDQAALPPAQELIDAHVLFGGATMMATDTMPWKLDVAVARENQVVLGLPIHALTQATRPIDHVAGDLSSMQNSLWLHFSQHDRATSKRKVRLSYVGSSFAEEDDLEALGPGDRVGSILIQLPSDQQIESAVIPYHELLGADAQQFRKLVDGNVLVLGDLRSEFGEPRHPTPDGRELCGVHAHAIAIDALLHDRSLIRYGTVWQYWIGLAAAGVVGALIGGRSVSGLRRLCLLIGGLALIVAISILALRLSAVLVNPVFPMIVLCMAMIVAMLLSRVQTPGLTSHFSRRPVT